MVFLTQSVKTSKVKLLLFFIFFSTLAFGANECVVCHKGIEDIRDRDSGMMKEILKVADKSGHEGNDCIVCHGGNPYNKSKEYAHKGTDKYFKDHDGPKAFYPSPTDPSVVKNTCGMCHQKHVELQYTSVNTFDDHNKSLGTKKYVEYMQKLSKKETKAFKKDNNTSSHASKKGCASCHIPYAKSGLYKGGDVRISKKTKGHVLTHKIQSSRDVEVSLLDKNYTGVLQSNCASCHSKGKFISLSYKGLLELKKDHHINLQEDIHFKKGMICQDCHTSSDLHGSGFGTNESLAAVEIECQDCHGSVKKYPWELPLGFGDEFNTTVTDKKGRGVAKDVAKYLKQGYVAKKEDGYLLSSRANPLPNVVKKGNRVVVHLANGNNIKLKPLKLLKYENELSKEALVAMDKIDSHNTGLECYACHSKWSAQYYGENENRFVRWEEPALAQNGEGRVSPVIQKGKNSLTAHPHTASKKARSCESCHMSLKSMGYGIESLEKKFTKIKDINSSFNLASVLKDNQLSKLDRRGMCISCHQTIPDGNLAVSAMTHIANMSEIDIDKDMHNYILSKLLDIGAWAQVVGVGFILLIIGYLIYAKFIRKKPVNPRNEGWK